MKKKLMVILAATCVALSGCGGETGSEGVDSSKTSAGEKTTYVISFDFNGGTSQIYTSGPRTVEYFDAGVFFFDLKKEGYSFRGWSYKGEVIFDETGKLYKTPEMEKEMTFVAIFEQNVRISVTKNMPEAGEITGEGLYDYNSYVDLSAHPYQGYSFVGWYYDDQLLSNSQDFKYTAWNEDVTLEARFELSSFIMRIYSNDSNYGLVRFNDDKNQYSSDTYNYVTYMDSLTVAAYSKSDVRFLGWYDEENKLVSTNPIYTFSMPNQDYTLEAKWNHFKIEYNLNGGTNSSNNPTFLTIDDEVVLSDAIGMDGFTFVGWFLNEEKVKTIKKGTIDNVTLEARWSVSQEQKWLTVLSSDSSSGAVNIVYNDAEKSGKITVQATPINKGVFYGWYENGTRLSVSNSYTFIIALSEGKRLVANFLNDADLSKIDTAPVFNSETNTVTYGLYPQTHVSNKKLISSLDELTYAEDGGLYLYDGSYYTKKSAKPYESSYKFSDGTKIVYGTKYWFRCEPIEWKVLSSSDGTYSLVSSLLLDAHCYNSSDSSRTIDGKTVYANNYEYSDIRSWLNGEFYSSAFALDDSLIQTVTVDNSAATTDSSTNKYACSDTEDKVYLLSYQDYRNADYFSNSESRRCCPTDWAKANGAYCCYGGYSYDGNGYYWTRSPDSSYSLFAWYVNYGDLDSSYRYVRIGYYCVRPSLQIKVA